MCYAYMLVTQVPGFHSCGHFRVSHDDESPLAAATGEPIPAAYKETPWDVVTEVGIADWGTSKDRTVPGSFRLGVFKGECYGVCPGLGQWVRGHLGYLQLWRPFTAQKFELPQRDNADGTACAADANYLSTAETAKLSRLSRQGA